jgi:hypothetical protein
MLALTAACSNPPEPLAIPPVTANPIDRAPAGRVTGKVLLTGAVPAGEPINMASDPYCDAQPDAVTGDYAAGSGGTLQNVFVYVKDGLGGLGFPIPTEPVLLDQDQCRYSPRVVGVRVGQPLRVQNSDPLLHNVRSNAVINQAFNKSTPIEGVGFTHAFATKEVMVPFKCDVHGWMSAYVGVLDHPYFGTTGPDGRVVLGNLPPGTYTIEAWHESLGTRTQQITIAAKESKDVSFSFAR